jgi:hypothetical protein
MRPAPHVVLLALATLVPAAAEATPLLSQTVYRCDSGCNLPVQNAGPVPVDAGAVESDTQTVALAPGAAVSGAVAAPPLAASADAQVFGDAPAIVHVLGEDTDLGGDGVVVAVVYWEDDVTITVPSLSIGTTLSVAPRVGLGGSAEAVAGDFAAGSVEWAFALAIGTDTFLATGGGCQPGLTPGPLPCSLGFGMISSGHFIANGVALNVQAGLVMRIQSVSDLTASVDVFAEWLGFELRDLSGVLLEDYSVESASGVDWTQSAVPEPGATLLLAAGAALLLRRRR